MHGRGDSVFEKPVLDSQPVQLAREVLKMLLLSVAGPSGRFPVRLHASQLSFLGRVNRPVRSLRTGCQAGPVSGFVYERKQVFYFTLGEHGLVNRRRWELNRFVEQHGLEEENKKERKETGKFKRVNRTEEGRGKGRNGSIGEGYLKEWKRKLWGPLVQKILENNRHKKY